MNVLTDLIPVFKATRLWDVVDLASGATAVSLAAAFPAGADSPEATAAHLAIVHGAAGVIALTVVT